MKAFVRGLLARAYEDPRKVWNQKKWQWKESAGFGCVTSTPPPEKGLENLTVADVLMIKDTDGGKVETWISCRTNDTVFDAVKNVCSSTPLIFPPNTSFCSSRYALTYYYFIIHLKLVCFTL